MHDLRTLFLRRSTSHTIPKWETRAVREFAFLIDFSIPKLVGSIDGYISLSQQLVSRSFQFSLLSVPSA